MNCSTAINYVEICSSTAIEEKGEHPGQFEVIDSFVTDDADLGELGKQLEEAEAEYARGEGQEYSNVEDLIKVLHSE